MKNCVVRTYSNSYINPTSALSEKLKNGWIVKMSVPFIRASGKTDYVEYILEHE